MVMQFQYGVIQPPHGCLYEGKLTKKALMSFPGGAILVGNGFNPDWTPSLLRTIPPADQTEIVVDNVVTIDGGRTEHSGEKSISSRELLWLRVKAVRWNGRLCRVFRDRSSAQKWLESIGARMPVTPVR